ncbi:Uncharacterised protein [Serratia fonticola]|nr:Uncharacterised protein [Serratia fonticola]
MKFKLLIGAVGTGMVLAGPLLAAENKGQAVFSPLNVSAAANNSEQEAL